MIDKFANLVPDKNLDKCYQSYWNKISYKFIKLVKRNCQFL